MSPVQNVTHVSSRTTVLEESRILWPRFLQEDSKPRLRGRPNREGKVSPAFGGTNLGGEWGPMEQTRSDCESGRFSWARHLLQIGGAILRCARSRVSHVGSPTLPSLDSSRALSCLPLFVNHPINFGIRKRASLLYDNQSEVSASEAKLKANRRRNRRSKRYLIKIIAGQFPLP